jgi:hypothetical protein
MSCHVAKCQPYGMTSNAKLPQAMEMETYVLCKHRKRVLCGKYLVPRKKQNIKSKINIYL